MTTTRPRRLQLPVMTISSLEDCLAITAWATLAVIRGTIDKGRPTRPSAPPGSGGRRTKL